MKMNVGARRVSEANPSASPTLEYVENQARPVNTVQTTHTLLVSIILTMIGIWVYMNMMFPEPHYGLRPS